MAKKARARRRVARLNEHPLSRATRARNT